MSDFITLPSGDVLELEWRYSKPSVFQAALHTAHQSKARPTCGCVPPRDLVIRRMEPREGRPGVEKYFLARMPNSGEEHAAECHFYEPAATKSGLGAYEDGVIRETDGELHVRLNRTLTRRKVAGRGEAALRGPAPVYDARGAQQRQRAMSPLGLLHLLWQQAALNEWSPKIAERALSTGDRLREAAERIRVGRASLVEVLGIVRGHPPTAIADLFADLWQPLRNCLTGRTERNVVVVGQLLGFEDQGKKGVRLAISKGWNPYRLLVHATPQQVEGYRRSFPYPCSFPQHAKVLALLVLEHAEVPKEDLAERPEFQGRVLDAGLMATTNAFIPVESAFECEVAERLVRDQRSFSKPLRFDATRDVVFPDFELRDTHAKLYPMEVFGRTDEAYARRRGEKEAYYRKEYGAGWWSWVAAGVDRTAMPPFPTRRR